LRAFTLLFYVSLSLSISISLARSILPVPWSTPPSSLVFTRLFGVSLASSSRLFAHFRSRTTPPNKTSHQNRKQGEFSYTPHTNETNTPPFNSLGLFSIPSSPSSFLWCASWILLSLLSTQSISITPLIYSPIHPFHLGNPVVLTPVSSSSQTHVKFHVRLTKTTQSVSHARACVRPRVVVAVVEKKMCR
jgi:hypothetical protein